MLSLQIFILYTVDNIFRLHIGSTNYYRSIINSPFELPPRAYSSPARDLGEGEV